MNSHPQTPFKRPESVLVVVFTRAGRVLLLNRADHPGFWQSITGSMEWGDTDPRETAVRELREETGLNVAPEALRDWQQSNVYELFPQWQYRYGPGVTHNREHIFSLELPAESVITTSPAEHCAHEWVSFDEAIGRVFSWTNRDALEALKRECEVNGGHHGAGDRTV